MCREGAIACAVITRAPKIRLCGRLLCLGGRACRKNANAVTGLQHSHSTPTLNKVFVARAFGLASPRPFLVLNLFLHCLNAMLLLHIALFAARRSVILKPAVW